MPRNQSERDPFPTFPVPGAPQPELGAKVHERLFFNEATPSALRHQHDLYRKGVERYDAVRASFEVDENIEFMRMYREDDITDVQAFYTDYWLELIRAA